MRTFLKAVCGVDNVHPCVYSFFACWLEVVLKTQQMKIDLIRTSFDALTLVCFALMTCVRTSSRMSRVTFNCNVNTKCNCSL